MIFVPPYPKKHSQKPVKIIFFTPWLISHVPYLGFKKIFELKKSFFSKLIIKSNFFAQTSKFLFFDKILVFFLSKKILSILLNFF